MGSAQSLRPLVMARILAIFSASLLSSFSYAFVQNINLLSDRLIMSRNAVEAQGFENFDCKGGSRSRTDFYSRIRQTSRSARWSLPLTDFGQRCDCCSVPLSILLMKEKGGLDLNTQTNRTSTESTLSTLQSALIGLLKGYKALISPLLPPSCRFLPTCSEYSMAAIAEFGPAKGLTNALARSDDNNFFPSNSLAFCGFVLGALRTFSDCASHARCCHSRAARTDPHGVAASALQSASSRPRRPWIRPSAMASRPI